MKRGDLVVWKIFYEKNLGSEMGILIERFLPPHEYFHYWWVAFPNKGILQCRESDLLVLP